LALPIAGAAVAVGVARNLILVGSWQGGNQMAVPHQLIPVVVASGQALNGIFVYGPGLTSDTPTVVARVLCLGLFYLGVLLLAWGYLRRRSDPSTQPPPPRVGFVVFDLLLLCVVYGA